jgi:type II secretory pathway pseudopilin PulG
MNINTFSKSGKNGFSFAEILIGVMILGVLLIPILGMFSESHRATKNTVEQSMALNLGSDVIEYARSMPFDGLTKNALDAVFNGTDTIARTTPDPTFEREINVVPGNINKSITSEDTAITTEIIMDYKLVTVETFWKFGTKKRSLLMSSIVINK